MRVASRVLVGVLLLCSSLLAQMGTSRISGTVQDKTGAVISSAKVSATNEETNVTYNTSSTAAGLYVFDGLPVARYTITVEARGFKKFISSHNTLTVGQPLPVNATLEVGAVSETVEVTGGAELVQTSSSGNFGNLVDQVSVTMLPIVGLRGRNPLQFMELQPGVVAGANTGGGVHVNGTRDRAQNFTLDGIDINETSAGGSEFSPLRTNPDSIAEFRVITSNFTAEYGRNSGSQVSMVTRSGSNDLHGTLFFFYQTPALRANGADNKAAGTPKPQFVQRIGGFSLGGPIQKNKTFFFTNLQFLNAFNTGIITSTVYTDQARKGIFRYVNGGACGSPCRNRAAGTTGASVDASGNVLPGVSVGTYNIATNDPQGLGLDSSIQQILGLTPSPNNFTVGDGLNTAGFTFNAAQLEQQIDWTLRLDHQFNANHSVFVRWAHGHQNTDGDVVNAGAAPFPGAPDVVATHRSPRNVAGSWRWNLNPRMTNELLVGMNRFIFDFSNPDPNFATNNPYAFNLITNPRQNYVGNARFLTTYQLADNMALAKGAHTFKWGINFRYGRHIDHRGSIGGQNASPAVDFLTSVNTVDPVAFRLPADINTTFDRLTLQSAINDLLGRVGNISQGFVAASDSAFAPAGTQLIFDARWPEYDLYVQDTWKLKPNLVLDLGLRLDARLTPRSSGLPILRPNQPFAFGLTPSNTLAWVKGDLYNNDWNNLGPSVGIAWDPFKDGKTSIRANYRLAYDRVNTFSLSSTVFANTPGETIGAVNSTFGSGGGRVRQGIPTVAPPAGATPISLRQPPAFSRNAITVVAPNLRTPKVHQWGLSFQRELTKSTVLTLSYVGNKGIGLYGGYDANQVQILGNGFVDAFNIVKAGGDSALMNQLLTGDARRRAGESGSQMVRRLFGPQLNLNSVAAVAEAIARQVNPNGVPVLQASGISPFFFMAFPQFSGSGSSSSLNGFSVLDTNDYSLYNALQVQVLRRFAAGLQFQVSYTWAKSMDTRSFDPTFSQVRRNNTQSGANTPIDMLNRRLNYAPSDFDRTHAFQANMVYELPFGSGKHWANHTNPVLDRIVGGWEISSVLWWESGRPYTVFSGSFTYSNVRQTPASCTGCSAGMGSIYFDSAAQSQFYYTPEQRALFSIPGAGQLSNLGARNDFRLPIYADVDAVIAKNIRVTENQKLQLRLEIQNLTNSVMYDTPGSSTFTSTIFSSYRPDLSGLFNAPRRMQVSAKYFF